MKINPPAIVAGILTILFLPVARKGYTLASNDGPLGSMVADFNQKPDGFSITWNDLNYIGGEALGPTPVSITGFLQTPGLPFMSALAITIFSLWYKPKKYKTYRLISEITGLGLCAVCGSCALLGLLDVISFYTYPWMFFLGPMLIGWVVTFGICHIITQQYEME